MDYVHLKCDVLLVAVDALHPDQIERMRNGENLLAPLTDETIDRVLESWREKLKRESKDFNGYVVLGYDA